MKPRFKTLLSFTMVATLLTSCSQSTTQNSNNSTSSSSSSSSSTSTNNTAAQGEKLKVIATMFPEYDWVREILGEHGDQVELIQLMDSGVDLHSYSPTVDDIINISTADLFIYNGGESDVWVEDVLSEVKNPDFKAINLLEALGELAKAEEHIVHSDEEDHDHAHDEEDHDHAHDEEEHDHAHDEEEHDHAHDEEEHDHAHDEEEHDHAHDEEEHDHAHDEEEHDHSDEEEHDHSDEEEHDHAHDEEGHVHSHDDEHIWLSLNNAQVLTQVIAEELKAIDPNNSSSYEKNANDYIEKLIDLDKEYEEMVKNAERNVILVADRFPFLYLTSDYNLEYYAAFSGCSAETEASFEIIVFLTEKVNEYNLPVVLTTETGHEISNTVIESSSDKNQNTLVLDSMQSTTSKGNDTYLSIMEDNLLVLTEALN